MISSFPRAIIALVPAILLTGCVSTHRADNRSPSAKSSQRMGFFRQASHNANDNRWATEFRYDITLEELRDHVQNNTAVIIDAREPDDFAEGHLAGAFNVPVQQKESYMARSFRDLPTDQFIIIYCGGPQCEAGDTVYDYATSQGFSNVRVYRPGWQSLARMRDLH